MSDKSKLGKTPYWQKQIRRMKKVPKRQQASLPLRIKNEKLIKNQR